MYTMTNNRYSQCLRMWPKLRCLMLSLMQIEFDRRGLGTSLEFSARAGHKLLSKHTKHGNQVYKCISIFVCYEVNPLKAMVLILKLKVLLTKS